MPAQFKNFFSGHCLSFGTFPIKYARWFVLRTNVCSKCWTTHGNAFRSCVWHKKKRKFHTEQKGKNPEHKHFDLLEIVADYIFAPEVLRPKRRKALMGNLPGLKDVTHQAIFPFFFKASGCKNRMDVWQAIYRNPLFWLLKKTGGKNRLDMQRPSAPDARLRGWTRSRLSANNSAALVPLGMKRWTWTWRTNRIGSWKEHQWAMFRCWRKMERYTQWPPLNFVWFIPCMELRNVQVFLPSYPGIGKVIGSFLPNVLRFQNKNSHHFLQNTE